MKNNFPEDSILVQLEEQMTVVSIVKDKEIVFQRTAPYGYGTALSAMLNIRYSVWRMSIRHLNFLGIMML